MSSVCPSVTLVDYDHIGWNSSEIISSLVSLGCSLSADPNIRGLLHGEHPEILAQSDPPVDLSVGDIRSQIAAEWLQWRAYRKPPSLFRMVPSLTPYDLPSPKMGVPCAPRYVNGHISATGDLIHFMFVLGQSFQGRRIEWRYFRLHQIQVGGRPPSWIISNGHISATVHSIHLYSAHRAAIFAMAQLSCLETNYRHEITTGLSS